MAITHCKVKFLNQYDNAVKIMAIDSIIEFKKKRPKNINDFDKCKVYECMYNDDKNENVVLPVQICALAEIDSERAMEQFNAKRGQFQNLNATTISEYYQECETEDSEDSKEDNENDSDTDIDKEKDAIEEKNKKKKKIKQIVKADEQMQMQIIQEKMMKLRKGNSLNIRHESDKHYNSDAPRNSEQETKKLIERLYKEIDVWQNKYNETVTENNNLKNKLEELESKLVMYKNLNENLNIKLYTLENKGVKKGIPSTDGADTTKTVDHEYQNFLLERAESSTPKIQFDNHNVGNLQNNESPHLSCDVSPSLIWGRIGNVKSTKIHSSVESTKTAKRNQVSPLNESFERNNLSKQKKGNGDFSKSDGDKHGNINEDISPPDCNNELDSSLPQTPSLRTTKKRKYNRILLESSDEEFTAEYATKEKYMESAKRNLFKANDKKQKVNNNDLKETDKENLEIPCGKKSDNSEEEKVVNVAEEKESTATGDSRNMFSKFRQTWTKQTEDGPVEMIYLNNNFSIELDAWQKALKCNDSMFVKKLFRCMYVFLQEASTRSVKQSDRLKTPKGTRTRKMISPLKSKTLERCLKYYYKKKKVPEGPKMEEKMEGKNKFLTEDINYAIKMMKNM